MKLDVDGRSNTGLVRSRNEDAYAIWPPGVGSDQSLSQVILAIADGMGGHPGGDVASALAVGTIREAEAPPEDIDSARDWLRNVHDAAANRLHERAKISPELREMGTTLTLALLTSGLCLVSHVGDTRLYWMRGSRCLCVTRDHTVAQEMVEAGRLAAAESEGHPMGNVLTRCLGVCADDRPDLLEKGLVLEAGDTLLLATDGLVKTVATRDLSSLIEGRSASEATENLVQAALAGGAPDNVTVIVARVLEVERDPTPGWTFDEAFALSPAV